MSDIRRPDSLDPGVRGRFAREISLPVPDANARSAILRLVTKHMTLSADVDFTAIGKATPGYVGADLHALASEAGLIAVRRIVQGMCSAFAPGAAGTDEASDGSSVGAGGVIGGLCESHVAVMKSLVTSPPPSDAKSQEDSPDDMMQDSGM
jgi:ribosome biogenesis ATPase